MEEKSEHIIRREHFIAGVETERERIIELLKANICDNCEEGYALHTGCEGNLDAIALIESDSK